VQGQNLLVEAAEATLMLGNQLRLEGAVAIAWRLESEFSHIAANGLFRVAIASVDGRGQVARRDSDLRQHRDLLTSEMNVHLGIEHALESGLHEAAHQPIEVV